MSIIHGILGEWLLLKSLELYSDFMNFPMALPIFSRKDGELNSTGSSGSSTQIGTFVILSSDGLKPGIHFWTDMNTLLRNHGQLWRTLS